MVVRIKAKVRQLARRFGYDIFGQMAGGRRIPYRVRHLISVPPIARSGRGVAEIADVEIANCSSFLGFAFAPQGWNPLVASLHEYISDPVLTYENSSLGRLHRSFTPHTLQELFFGMEQRERLYPLCNLPPSRKLYRYIWEVNQRRIAPLLGQTTIQSDNYYFGPQSAHKGAAEFSRLLDVYEKIKDEGYAPCKYGFITGYFMADDRSYRFIVGSGNHRMAALAAMGVTTVRVQLHSHPAVIHRRQLDDWTCERGGPFPRDTALALFEQMLHGFGHGVAKCLHLPSR